MKNTYRAYIYQKVCFLRLRFLDSINKKSKYAVMFHIKVFNTNYTQKLIVILSGNTDFINILNTTQTVTAIYFSAVGVPTLYNIPY